MAAAIILIPEMLSGPRRDAAAPAQTPSPDGSMKTITIDLNRAPGVPATVGEVDDRAPPSETPASEAHVAQPLPPTENPLPVPQAIPDSSERAPQSQERMASEAPPRPTIEPRSPSAANAGAQERPPIQPPAPRETSTSSRPPVASAPSVPTSRGWAVQLGSFASRGTADRMVKDLAQRGQNAFVMPVKSGSATLYRVRIGPFADRNVANEALREVKGQVANAAVVAHP